MPHKCLEWIYTVIAWMLRKCLLETGQQNGTRTYYPLLPKRNENISGEYFFNGYRKKFPCWFFFFFSLFLLSLGANLADLKVSIPVWKNLFWATKLMLVYPKKKWNDKIRKFWKFMITTFKGESWIRFKFDHFQTIL